MTVIFNSDQASSVFQGNRNKNKNKQIGPNQTYEVLHSKGNHKQSEKTTGENICKQCYQQGLHIQNIQTAHITQYQKNKQSNQKVGRRLK